MSSIYFHVKTEHLKIKKKCLECNKLYPVGTNYDHHIVVMHGSNKSDKIIRCELCDYSVKDVKTHIRKIHLDIRKHPCDKCSYKAQSSTGLEAHITFTHY